MGGVTTGGNLSELLRTVDNLGNNLTWFQSVGSSTIHGAGITISGPGN